MVGWRFRISLAIFFVSFSCFSAFAKNETSSQVDHHLFTLQLEAGVVEEIVSPFPFHGFAVSRAEEVEVRFLQAAGWSSWQQLRREEPELAASELLFLSETKTFQIRSMKDREVVATVLKVREDALQVVQNDQLVLDTGVGDPSFHIISRKEWGADESLGIYTPKPDNASSGDADERDNVNICAPIEKAYPGQYEVSDKVVAFDELGRPLIWPRTYSNKVKKIVIHHTAQTLKDLTGDGRIDKRDYKLAVQAIYVYHTVSRGWGDIGYHYLVDPDGNVYEGRAGGPEVIGAHVLCQNSNMVGISVMGNFEEQKISQKSFEGLVNITKYLTDLYHINPLAQSSFRGAAMPHIVTHTEVGQLTRKYIGQGGTQCPGDDLVAQMDKLRKTVAEGGILPNYAYEVLSTPKNLTVNPLQNVDLRVTLKNTGSQTWNTLNVYSKGSKTPIFTRNAAVLPGQQVEVSVLYRAELDEGTKQDTLSVEVNSTKIKKNFKVSYRVNRPVYKYDVVSLTGFKDPLLVGEKRIVQIKLRNTGNFPWLNEGRHSVQLREISTTGDEVVVNPTGVQAFFSQIVSVGEEIEVRFELPVPSEPGAFTTEFLPMVGRDRGLKGKRLLVDVPVELPRFAAEVRPEKRSTVAQRGFEQEVSFQITNRSNFDWEANTVAYQLKGTEKMLISKPVEKGASFVFPVLLRAGYDAKEVSLAGSMSLEKLPALLEKGSFRPAKISFQEGVPARGAVKFMADLVSLPELPAVAGAHEVKVQLMNTGNVPWYKSGADRIVLTLVDKADYYHKSWERRKMAGVLQTEVVQPGETATFVLTLDVRSLPKRTTYDEFVPVIDGKPVKLRQKIKIGVEIQGTREKKEERTQPSEDVRQDASTDQELEVTVSAIPPVRVWLSDVVQDELQVTSPGKFVVWDSKSVQIKTLNASEVFTLRTSDVKEGVVFRLKAQEQPYLELKNWGIAKQFGTKKYLDNTFRNVLEFRLVDGKLTVINELSLEDYMKGIAEVPETDDQPPEKRKTIAVLARSYALHYLISGYEKFPGKPYNAANSPAIFQKYLGYGFEQRAPKWQEALKETEGEVVMVESSALQVASSKIQDPNSKQGLVLRAAYFSCTDGARTKSWSEVWSDNEYFKKFGSVFQSVEDPLGDDPSREGLTACGHQVGLSGYGATQMAKNGKNYRDIIQHYYQGVVVERY